MKYVKPKVLQWALDEIEEEELDDETRTLIYGWMDGSIEQTFDGIKKISKTLNIPLGYFFLDEPPKENYDLLNYRTYRDVHEREPTRNLLATIAEMERVHDWMAEYRRETDYGTLSYVDSCNESEKAEAIAKDIRESLHLIADCPLFFNCNSKKSYKYYVSKNPVASEFRFFRGRLDKCGVLVMMNGVVGNYNKRPLYVQEFRAFAIVDNVAPLIFINRKDTDDSKLFSLLHETAHVWLGKNDLLDWDVRGTMETHENYINQIERLCNDVAVELLLPNKAFLDEWDDHATGLEEEIFKIANKFRCGRMVVIKRAFENKKIDSSMYNCLAKEALDNYDNQLSEVEKKEKKDASYNGLYIMRNRTCASLINALCESIYMGRTSYTEAFRLTNTYNKSFFKVADKYDDEEVNKVILNLARGYDG